MMDWLGLMRAGMHRLRLRPDEFWALTPMELALMLGVEPVGDKMTRKRLEEILVQFPDGR